MNTNLAFLLSGLAGLSTLIGAFTIFLSRKKSLNFLVSGIAFASSVMLFISLFDLLPESVRFLKSSFNPFFSLLLTLIFLSLGIVISIIIDKFFPNSFDEKSLYKLGIITMIGIIMHNLPEGIATFITTSKNIKLGISITIAISMHNIPEGISIALPIYYYTRSYKKAFFYTFICALSEPFGAFLAYLFLKPNFMTLGMIYALIAGIMIHIAVYELLPSACRYKRYKTIFISYILGLLLVIFNIILFA